MVISRSGTCAVFFPRGNCYFAFISRVLTRPCSCNSFGADFFQAGYCSYSYTCQCLQRNMVDQHDVHVSYGQLRVLLSKILVI